MISIVPRELESFVDAQRFAQILSIPESHFYGVFAAQADDGVCLNARYSPLGERPLLIKIDGDQKNFFCSCQDFQKRALYPARMGIFLCDHILRALTLADSKDRETLGLGLGQWACLKLTPDFERSEILSQTHHFFEQGDVLAALNEMYFGIQSACLRDLDVASLLDQVPTESVEDYDLPEAIRFIRLALQRGFTRKGKDLAVLWLARFAQKVDTFAPFDDVAPVALWMKRWQASPDIHFTSIRDVLLDALAEAKEKTEPGASWWLLYRAISRAGTAPPDSCVRSWVQAIEGMRLALAHPDRINDAARLLNDFGFKIPTTDEEFEKKQRQSLRRSRQGRMGYLLRLAEAHHLEPFIEVNVNPYTSGRYVGIETPAFKSPLQEMILSTIGIKGQYLPIEHFVENWPIIKQLLIKDVDPDPALQVKIKAAWPDPVSPAQTVRRPHRGTITSEGPSTLVARWELSSPGLVANSPLVAHHESRIYIPARGASHWPDAFGLTMCQKPIAMGRRLFTLSVTRRIDARQAIELLDNGATFVGPRNDPMRLLTLQLESLPLDELLDLPAALSQCSSRLLKQTWILDRETIRERIPAKIAQVSAWGKKRLFEELAKGERIRAGKDIGFLFGEGLQLFVNEKAIQAMVNRASTTSTFRRWLASLPPVLAQLLPEMDRPEAPISIPDLANSSLRSAVPKIVDQRKHEVAKLDLKIEGGYLDLAPLKQTVYGRKFLADHDLLGRNRLRKAEAEWFLRELAKLDLGVEDLPLFAKANREKDQG